jgi:hypothetical protein
MDAQPDLFQRPPHEVLNERHIRNQKLLSSYYLAYRLPQRALWSEVEDRVRTAMDRAKTALARAEELGVLGARSEAETEQEFIRPVLDALGWQYIVQPSLGGYEARRRPDYALYAEEGARKAAGMNRNVMSVFYGKAAAIAEAKYWGRPMNDRDDSDPYDKSDATKQIASYLRDVTEWTDGKTNWGFLTNGRLWRLFQRRAGYTAENCLEIDLEAVLRSDDREAFKYFFILFGRDSYVVPSTGTLPWLLTLVEESEDYSSGITEHLKELIFHRVFDSLVLGFARYRRQVLGIPVEMEDRASCVAIYQGCLTLLYRLLFLLNAESRELLPMGNPGYRKRSLRSLMEKVHQLRGEDMDADHDFACWEHLRGLFSLMDDGNPTFNLPRYNGGLFARPDPSQQLTELPGEEVGPWFLETHRLSDPYVCDILRSLTFDPKESTGAPTFIDYSSLGVRHLGEIYEGLLEFGIEFAVDEPMCLVGTRAKALWKAKSRVEVDDRVLDERAPGEPLVVNDRRERRTSGSYYTPHHIVEYIVDQTIGQRLRQFQSDWESCLAIGTSEGDGLQRLYDRREKLGAADESRGELWRLCRSDAERRDFLCSELSVDWGKHRFDVGLRALELKILDPAMGSGHFLVHAVDVISDAIVTYLDHEPNSPVGELLDDLRAGILRNTLEQAVAIDDRKLTDVNLIKRIVMKRCIYGVDVNPMAVELAKLSLWLDCFTVGAPLSFLNHHLRCGNSLVGSTVGDVGEALAPAGEGTASLWGSQFTGLMTAVEAMRELGELSDATISEVEESYSRYREASDALAPFKVLLDLWTSDAFGVNGARQLLLSTPDQAEGAIAATLRSENVPSKKWEKAGTVVRDALGAAKRERFFHWELEFPEVWYEKGQARTNPGFDVVFGNPPYDVLSERETGAVLQPLKAYLRSNPVYTPSFHGKNNLYKLFICRGVCLLSNGGYLGLITPMAILGDDQAVQIRRHLLSNGRFASVDAFPQKDNAKLRVFKDAKLATAVFTYVVAAAEGERRRPFISRVHRANRVEADSPALKLDASGIPLYDPANLTIVSCSQEDWDLAVRMMASGRLVRLRDVARSFQGEVNETNDRRAGRISYHSTDGVEVMRGANVCLYSLRSASQGTPVYLRKARFLKRTAGAEKIHHHREARVGFQRKSPQNNYRRLIAAPIPPGAFLLESVSYVPQSESRVPLALVLALLNSKLVDWYFRLGSSNAMIGAYQFENLPFPRFAEKESAWTEQARATVCEAVSVGDVTGVADAIAAAIEGPPFDLAASAALIALTERISAIETARATMPRAERSQLSEEAQRYQDAIDRIVFAMAGLTREESGSLEVRLGRML